MESHEGGAILRMVLCLGAAGRLWKQYVNCNIRHATVCAGICQGQACGSRVTLDIVSGIHEGDDRGSRGSMHSDKRDYAACLEYPGRRRLRCSGASLLHAPLPLCARIHPSRPCFWPMYLEGMTAGVIGDFTFNDFIAVFPPLKRVDFLPSSTSTFWEGMTSGIIKHFSLLLTIL